MATEDGGSGENSKAPATVGGRYRWRTFGFPNTERSSRDLAAKQFLSG